MKQTINKLNSLLFERIHIQRIYLNDALKDDIIGRFHKLYYDSAGFGEIWNNTSFLGVKTSKLPLDLWIYQEIIYQTRPDIIIETGTFCGGSAFFLASICELIGHGKVITIDLEKKEGLPVHKRIKYLFGSSTSPEIIRKIRSLIRGKNKVMAILDSDHHKEHVLKEMQLYSRFVTKGNYLIVEDTNINGHPVYPEYGPGPMEAVREFLRHNKNFVIDREREKFYLTFNPKGYLRKTK